MQPKNTSRHFPFGPHGWLISSLHRTLPSVDIELARRVECRARSRRTHFNPVRIFVAVVLGFFCAASTASAQSVCLPAPRLLTTMPMGGQVGTEVEVVITGEAIEDGAARRQGIDIGCLQKRMAIAAEKIGALLVGDEENEAGAVAGLAHGEPFRLFSQNFACAQG